MNVAKTPVVGKNKSTEKTVQTITPMDNFLILPNSY